MTGEVIVALQRVLHVEDDESIIAIARVALETLGGLTVLSCSNGNDALEQAPAFDPELLLLDVMMPGMDGPTLLKQGRSLLGEARIVFISGYAEEHFSDLLSEEPDVTFLPKPFTLVQLAEKVKSEIGEAQ